MDNKLMARPFIGAIGLLALASTLPENVIKIASAETFNYLYEKIQVVSAAIGHVGGVSKEIDASHSFLAAIDVSQPITAVGLAEHLLTINLPDLGTFHTGLANFLQINSSVSGHSDAGAPQASSDGSGGGNAAAGTSLVNTVGMPGGVPGSGGAPNGRPFPRVLPDFHGPQLLAERPVVLPNNLVASNTAVSKDCAGANAMGFDAGTKKNSSAYDCSIVAIEGETKHMESGDSHSSSVVAGGRSSMSSATAASTGASGPINSSPSVTTVSDNTILASTTFSLGLPSGDYSENNRADGTTLATSALLPTAIPLPPSLALLSLGLGCLLWALRPRNTA